MSSQPVSRHNSSEVAGALPASLPVTGNLTLTYLGSLVLALLTAIVSIAGIVNGTSLYQTEEMLLQKVPTDLFTLVVALPVLLGSIWLARRGKLVGLLCWPAILFYLLYIYTANAIGVPFGVLFLPYIAIAALSAYTLLGLVATIDAKAVQQQLAGAVPARPAGGILVGISILFTLMNLAQVVTALTSSAPDHLLYLPVWIADFLVLAPAWIAGGLLLWRRDPLGYVAGTGMFLLGCVMFVGPIFALIYTALYTASPIDLAGIALVLVAGLICFIPFALFVRGIVRLDRRPSPARE